MKNLFKEIILGSALGDALGVPVEFRERSYLKRNPVKGMIGYGTHNQPKGTWSDDTSLLIATGDALLQGEIYDLRLVKENFINWYYNGDFTPRGVVFDCGGTVALSISYMKNYPEKKIPNDLEICCGNGSLMRIGIIFPFLLDMDEETALYHIHRFSSLTHGHDKCTLSCLYLYYFWKNVILGYDWETCFEKTQRIFEYIFEDRDYSPVAISSLDPLLHFSFKDFSRIPEGEVISSGYVIDTLISVIWCCIHSSSFKDGVLRAVNLGGDTDTIGAITGMILGCKYGEKSFPRSWLKVLAKEEELISLANKLNLKYYEIYARYNR